MLDWKWLVQEARSSTPGIDMGKGMTAVPIDSQAVTIPQKDKWALYLENLYEGWSKTSPTK